MVVRTPSILPSTSLFQNRSTPVTFLGQAPIPNCVGSRFIVLPAVDFDNQMPFAANEIADVAEDRDLPSELVPVDLTITNAIPENGFRICLIDPQSPRDSDGLFVAATHCLAPHPEPSPRDASDLSPQ
jgi:hypothetical protein